MNNDVTLRVNGREWVGWTVSIFMRNSGRVETIVNTSKGKNKGEHKSQCTVVE
ncbi:Uncharacterised protein [Yersinia frederiksenii]|uniref:Uncharacterized protein n=1 Tax=Yersinia frederiksenii TaxID=29484 RepID=A0AAI8ZUY6_YERFR|nr:Uncharacterised protein [Yersinia frederiksenii]